MEKRLQDYMPQVKAFFESHREEFLADLAALIAIDSQRTEAKEGMPYGEGPAAALAKTLEMAEGYITKLALDKNGEVIGYENVQLGKMMEYITNGMNADEALKKATSRYGRFENAASYINPRQK